jgi:hypothetical protein
MQQNTELIEKLQKEATRLRQDCLEKQNLLERLAKPISTFGAGNVDDRLSAEIHQTQRAVLEATQQLQQHERNPSTNSQISIASHDTTGNNDVVADSSRRLLQDHRILSTIVQVL